MRCASLGFAALVCSSLTPPAWGQPRREPPTVGVEQVVERDLTPKQTFIGEVVPARTSVVGSAVDGRVVEVAVQEGQEVSVAAAGSGATRPEGEPLALLLTDTISLEIEAAQATLELRRQELAELLAGSRPEEIAQARARWESAQALQVYATSRYDRVAALFLQTTVSREDFEEALSTKLSAEQNEIAAQAACKLAVDGPREEQKKQAAARLAVAEKEVERLQDRLKKHTIRTPFAGFVTAKHVEVGQWVSAGDPIAEIVELDPIEINVPVPERFIAHVHVGAEASVRLEALPEQAFAGKVARIVPQADVRRAASR